MLVDEIKIIVIMRKHYYIYEIVCLKGEYKDKYYIGKHETYNLKDGYAGSGAKLLEYYSKYGKIKGKTYKMHILSLDEATCTDELNILEIQYIANKWRDDPMCLNMQSGGDYEEHEHKLRYHIVKDNKPVKYESYNEYNLKQLIDYCNNIKTTDIEYKDLLLRCTKYYTTPSLVRSGYYGSLSK